MTLATVTSPDGLGTALLQALILLATTCGGGRRSRRNGAQHPGRGSCGGLSRAGVAVGLPPPPSCVDREVLLAELGSALLAAPASPVAVFGGPGMGKSTVCRAWRCTRHR